MIIVIDVYFPVKSDSWDANVRCNDLQTIDFYRRQVIKKIDGGVIVGFGK